MRKTHSAHAGQLRVMAAALRDFVQARDKTCVFPGCSVPAHRADIDHTKGIPRRPDRARESRSDVPGASPSQAGPPLDGVPADSGTFRMDDPEQPDLHSGTVAA
jgi:hypothetical protein